MKSSNFIILVILYAIFFCTAFYILIKEVFKAKKIELSDFFKLFYIFFYGLVPICTLIAFKQERESIIKCFFIENTNDYLKYILYFLTIMFYILYNIAFKYIKKKDFKLVVYSGKIIDENSKNFYVGNLVLLIVGWISLFVYTFDYGGIFSTFKYAEDIRNNLCTITNRFTYFQPFTMLLLLLPFNYVVLLNKFKDKSTKYKIITILLFVLSVIGSSFVLLIIDSRGRMLMTILIIVYYFYKEKILNFNKKSMVKLAIIMVSFSFLLINSENISGFLHNQNRTEQQTKINEFVAQEFGYTYLNGINVIDRKFKNTNGDIRFFKNVYAITISLLPRSIQKKMVVNMPTYNTSFYHRNKGTVPSDLITSSIYSLGYIGPIIFPFFMALLTCFLNSIIKKGKGKSNYYKMMESYLGFQVCMSLISNYDMSAIIFSCFELIVWIIVIHIFSIKQFGKFVNKIYRLVS